MKKLGIYEMTGVVLNICNTLLGLFKLPPHNVAFEC